MADRNIFWAGATPLDTDGLQSQKNMLKAIGFLAQATLGTNTIADGLVVAPTSPASMAIQVGAGSIYFQTVVDTTSYGSLPIDNTPVMKQGVNTLPTTLTINAPLTAGYSQQYLIQAAFLEQDIDPVVLPYFNAANPSQPYSGPNNDGLSSYTIRADTVALQALAGTPAPTGQEITPPPTAGYTPLAVVTVAYGATSITSTNISPILTSYIGTKLGNLPYKLPSNLSLYVASPSVFPGASDGNSGLSPNTPFATIQGAYTALTTSYNLNNLSATINIGAGNFGALNAAGLPQGYGSNSSVVISGAGASTIVTSTGLQSAMGATLGGAITVENMTITGTYGVNAGVGSSIVVGSGVTFSTCSVGQIIATGGQITIFGGYNITGSSPAHWLANANGSIQTFGTNTIIGTGTQNFSTGFATAITGNMALSNLTFTGCGSFTGARYNVTGGGFINSGGLTFPGNASGTLGTANNIGFFE